MFPFLHTSSSHYSRPVSSLPFTHQSHSATKENVTGNIKRHKTQSDETEQAPEQDMTRTLELSDQNFKLL